MERPWAGRELPSAGPRRVRIRCRVALIDSATRLKSGGVGAGRSGSGTLVDEAMTSAVVDPAWSRFWSIRTIC